MTWVGLDLHKRYITACAMSDAGVIVAEHRRLPADEATLLGWLAALPGPVTVAMEATLYWAWLHERLTMAGYAAVAAHPYQVKLIWQARCKTDPIDARKLAELARTNLLPTVWVPDAKVLARRKLLRGRAYLVRLRTRMKNRLHGYLTAENCRCLVTDLYGKAGRRVVTGLTDHRTGRALKFACLSLYPLLLAGPRHLGRRAMILIEDCGGLGWPCSRSADR